MAIALVQDQQAALGATTTVTVTLGAGATAGNLLVACCSYRADRTLTIPSGFTLAKDQQNTSADTTHQDANISHTIAAGGETAFVFTISATGNVAGWVGEYAPTSGETWASPVDQTGGNQGSVASALLSASVTTTRNDEVAVVVFGYNDAGSGLPASRGYTNSYAEQGFANNGTNNAIAVAHLILTATATTNTNASWTNACSPISATATFMGATAAAAASLLYNPQPLAHLRAR